MNAEPQPELQQVKTAFKNFRAGRVDNAKPRLPEQLWSQAIALLEHYPFAVVCRELRVKPKYLRQRAATVQQSGIEKFRLPRPAKKSRTKPQQDFLPLTARDLSVMPSQDQLLSSTSACRVMIERTDGSRLQLTVAMD
jgi:hypothetical protein